MVVVLVVVVCVCLWHRNEAVGYLDGKTSDRYCVKRENFGTLRVKFIGGRLLPATGFWTIVARKAGATRINSEQTGRVKTLTGCFLLYCTIVPITPLSFGQPTDMTMVMIPDETNTSGSGVRRSLLPPNFIGSSPNVLGAETIE